VAQNGLFLLVHLPSREGYAYAEISGVKHVVFPGYGAAGIWSR
jgi:hypothetical protein